MFHNKSGLEVEEPYKTTLEKKYNNTCKGSHTDLKEYQLEGEVKLYCKVKFQGNGPDNQNECYEQHIL